MTFLQTIIIHDLEAIQVPLKANGVSYSGCTIHIEASGIEYDHGGGNIIWNCQYMGPNGAIQVKSELDDVSEASSLTTNRKYHLDLLIIVNHKTYTTYIRYPGRAPRLAGTF